MSKTLSITQKITLTAMLLVLDIVATHILRTPMLGNLPFIRLSLGPALVIYASLLLGPFYGAIVGGLGDLLGILVFSGIEGQINFLLTIVYALLGILPWCLEKLTRHFRKSLQKPYFIFGAMLVVLILLACLFYVIPSTKDYFSNGFGSIASWIEPLILALTALFDIIAFFGLFFANRFFEKNKKEYENVPSPYEMAVISFLCEISLMMCLKPLAFYLFYNFLSSSVFPISYAVLFSCMFVFGGLNIVINTFIVYWLLIFTKKYLIKDSN